MAGATTYFDWPFPNPGDRLADGATVIGNAIKAIEAQFMLPPDSRSQAALVTQYPIGASVMTLTTAGAQAGNWRDGVSAIIFTVKRSDNLVAFQIWCQNTAVNPRMRYRVLGGQQNSDWNELGGRALPDAMAAGNLTITTGNDAVGSAAVVYPSGRFPFAPRVFASAMLNVPWSVAVSTAGGSANGFTFYMWRQNAGSGGANWSAILMEY